MSKKTLIIVLTLALALSGIVFMLMGMWGDSSAPSSTSQLRAVAAENFWGSIVSQIGGSRVRVVSVVSDPNADPHEYESNTATARAFADAGYVVINGAGYDDWAEKLLSAGPNPKRKVLDVAEFLGKKNGDNPHFWYDPDYVNAVAEEIKNNLISLDPAGRQYYEANYEVFRSSVAEYQARIVLIRQQFSGAKVAATEDVFVYLANAAGLDLISPPAFMQAVAEGNDPPAQSVVGFQNQLRNKEPEVLVYNKQTVTPLTDGIEKLAAEEGIPVIGITETIQPPDAFFGEWMDAELTGLQTALNAGKLGQ